MEERNGSSAIDWFLLSMAHSQLGEADMARKWYDQADDWMRKNQPNHRRLRDFRIPAEKLLKSAEQKKATTSESN
jgi:hypothetical protein